MNGKNDTNLIERSQVRAMIMGVANGGSDADVLAAESILSHIDRLPIITATDPQAATGLRDARNVILSKIGNLRTDLRQLREKQIALEAELRGLQEADEVLDKYVGSK